MTHFLRHLNNVKANLALLVCTLISIILLFSNKNQQVDSIMIMALQYQAKFQERISGILPITKFDDENRTLRLKNTRLALENSQMREAIIENSRLRELVSFKEMSPFTLIPAKVIGGSSTGFINHIILNVGGKRGIRKDMPIVLSDGLVGRIYRVSEDYSLGHLLLDKNSRVSAKIAGSDVKGILNYLGDGRCSLNGVPNRSDVTIADSVVTSGYSEIFPEGLFIGTVASVDTTTRSLFMDIMVTPGADFEHLEEVLIITSNTP